MNRMFHQSVVLIVALTVCFNVEVRQAEAQKSFPEGIDPGIAYTVDLLTNLRGGKATGVRFMDNLDIELLFDTGKLIGMEGGELYFYGLANQGGELSEDLTGDFQVASNIETDESWRFYELWYQQTIPRIRSSFLAGLYDLNSEFDVNETGLLFLNSSHGIGAAFGNSGVLGPSIFPLTSVGARFKINPWDGLLFKTAVLDGIPSDPDNTDGTKIFFRKDDGLLVAAELSYYSGGVVKTMGANKHGRLRHFLSREAAKEYRLKVAAGGWVYTKKRSGWISTDGTEHHDMGIYLLGDFPVYRETVDRSQGLSAFIRLGLANGEINRLNGYAGSGFVYTGSFKNRSDDQMGVAVAYAVNSSEFRDFMRTGGEATDAAETNIEATYLIHLYDQLNLQFDLQYIINPNTDPSLDNAVVIGIRTQLSF